MGKWIPLSEMMPEESDTPNLLLYMPKRDGVHQSGIRIGYLKHFAIKEDRKGERNLWGIPTDACDWVVFGWSYFEKPIPTHWMPMPETPIDVKEEA